MKLTKLRSTLSLLILMHCDENILRILKSFEDLCFGEVQMGDNFGVRDCFP